jgi:hypothetical protein
MASKEESIIGSIQLPMEILKKVLPVEGVKINLGEQTHTKIEYLGKGYLIHWMPAIHIIAIGDLEAIDKEIVTAEEQRTQTVARKDAASALKVKFNELTATPVSLDTVPKP